MQLSNQINFYKNIFRLYLFLYTGSLLKLKFFDLLFVVSNLGLNKPKYSLSLGTYCVINNKKKKFIIITLPSGKRIKHTNNGFALFGRNTGIFSYKQYFGKASSSLSHKNITVRSVAKNPVDHPNGGRTRGKMCFKTP
jgi:ribosomal protein L2